MNNTRQLLAALLCSAGFLASASALAQGAGLKRELVEKADVSVPNREAIVARIEVAPGVIAGRHSHAGEEISYVLEGEGELLVDGQPPRKLKAGDAFVVPAGTVHDAKNTGTVPMKLIGVFVVEKGKPLATPAASR